MPFDFKQLLFAGLTVLGAIALEGAAHAADYSSAASYNSPYGLAAGAENQTINPSLRDANGNLTVDQRPIHQFRLQPADRRAEHGHDQLEHARLRSAPAPPAAAYGNATAIGNSLNVVTVGNNNTVVVNSSQTNNGNQSASVSLNGH